jgi:hypothetical protein
VQRRRSRERRTSPAAALAAAAREVTMFLSFPDIQALAKDNLDTASRTLAAMSQSLQALASDSADYTRRSFETSAAAMQGLAGARSIDKAMEIQADYARSAYEAMVAQTARYGDALTDLARETAKPLEGFLAKTAAR